ncbi:thiamine pyrophosphate-dependent enzyme [Roseofilum casamattae]|uniref:Thiamine pyrophosphate-dependent enzyme n=1 Tax=Roseofilum casamattae BLCC-M143 TaxID=3022442 RepID=A0ABT7BSZ8_9CYAN|nr:thiamine pyrophosphate-dependent enzyme [Roseofilum casamattae]MDJ1182305.1 thiamine pyrophosphate-dependent enzyme [Roseofilum casamattae BLCC-M143]
MDKEQFDRENFSVETQLLAARELYARNSQDSISVSEAVIKILKKLKVTCAFGVSGGAIAPFYNALVNSELKTFHFHHESGATFAACEASLASGKPVAVFVTTGPGITNALTGLFAGKWEGAKVIFLSASTSPKQWEGMGFQKTNAHTMPADLFAPRKHLFDYATTLESRKQFPGMIRHLAIGFKRSQGFLAHISLPTGKQRYDVDKNLLPLNRKQKLIGARVRLPVAPKETIQECAKLLFKARPTEPFVAPFAILVGFGARNAAEEIRQFAEATKAAVMCSPRGKGIFPENHPQFIGVTGFGGHHSVFEYLETFKPERVLVLGSSFSQFTWFENEELTGQSRFIQVDPNPEVLSVGNPWKEVLCVQSEIRPFVRKLHREYRKRYQDVSLFPSASLPNPAPLATVESSAPHWVHPKALMAAIQTTVIDKHDLLVMAEPGNSFAWTIHCLQFTQPYRYRVSVGFGSLGHFVTGVIGATLVLQKQAENKAPQKAVVVAGDGAMLMNGGDLSTAVKYKIPAIWIVLNDGRYNMCEQGMTMEGFKNIDVGIPDIDFLAVARALGADGIRVNSEADLEAALEQAVESEKPFVVDVVIDYKPIAPIASRVQSLKSQSPGACQ